MRLMRPAEVPVTDSDQLFVYSRRQAIVATMLFTVVTGVVAYLLWLKEPWPSYLLLAVMLLFALISKRLVTARFKPENWLMRLTNDGMYIKFRSYLNGHFPDQDATVVYFSHSEIRSAYYIVEKQEVPDRDDHNRPATTTKTNKLVELELVGDTSPLVEALLRERHYAVDGQSLPLEITTRYHHLPVRLPSADKLQIEWAVVPKAQNLLDALTRHTLVRPTEQSAKDFVNIDALSRAEQETRLFELAESGDKIGAIVMARRLHGYDLSQAKEFVEGLATKRSVQKS